MNMNTQARLSDFLKSPSGLLTLALVVAGVFFVVAAYGDTLLRWLPYGLILLCLLIHLLLHRGHSGHKNHSNHTHNEEQ
jgi:Flp pilus assembly protein TadB